MAAIIPVTRIVPAIGSIRIIIVVAIVLVH
jgi:hypothetical protein